MPLPLIPVTLAEANAFVARHHRHHGRVRGCLFCIGLAHSYDGWCAECFGNGVVDVEGTESGESECPRCDGRGKGVIVAVVIVGRPVARELQDGFTAEVTRLATDGSYNACSKLYGAAWRACKAMGYRRLVTYTLPEEGGTSLRAAGWRLIGEAGGGTWDRPASGRPRVDLHPTQTKLRWEVGVG